VRFLARAVFSCEEGRKRRRTTVRKSRVMRKRKRKRRIYGGVKRTL
jgi:hypothetical protein